MIIIDMRNDLPATGFGVGAARTADVAIETTANKVTESFMMINLEKRVWNVDESYLLTIVSRVGVNIYIFGFQSHLMVIHGMCGVSRPSNYSQESCWDGIGAEVRI